MPVDIKMAQWSQSIIFQYLDQWSKYLKHPLTFEFAKSVLKKAGVIKAVFKQSGEVKFEMTVMCIAFTDLATGTASDKLMDDYNEWSPDATTFETIFVNLIGIVLKEKIDNEPSPSLRSATEIGNAVTDFLKDNI
jgi:hypothetical protein